MIGNENYTHIQMSNSAVLTVLNSNISISTTNGTLGLNSTLTESWEKFDDKKYWFTLDTRDTFEDYLNDTTGNNTFAPSFNQKGAIYLDSMSNSTAPGLDTIIVDGESLGIRLAYYYEEDPYMIEGYTLNWENVYAATNNATTE